MDYNYIHELLKKYWACETSVEEEQKLKQFFATEDVPTHLLSYKSWFVTAEQPSDLLGNDFDEKILAQISSETITAKRRPLIRRIIQVAAVLAIILSGSFLFRSYHEQNSSAVYASADTFDNPEEALAVVRNTLSFTSRKINEGLDMTKQEFRRAEQALSIEK